MDKRRNAYLLRKYGITEEQYGQVLHRQGGTCAVCPARTFTRSGGSLAVDHDHSTGEIRGLLCYFCNLRLIGKHRDAEKFERAGRYLRGPYTGWFVPKKPKRKAKRRVSRRRKKTS